MSNDRDEKWRRARERALANGPEEGSPEDSALEEAARNDPDNPPLDERFWSRAKPLDPERLKRMQGPGVRRKPKVPAAGE